MDSIDEEKWIALHVECLNFYRKLASMLDGSLNDAAFDLLCQIMEVFPNKFWSTVFGEQFDLLKEYVHDCVFTHKEEYLQKRKMVLVKI